MLRRIEMIDLPAKRRLLHKYCAAASFFSSDESAKGNRQISRRMDTHGIIVVERFATFHYY